MFPTLPCQKCLHPGPYRGYSDPLRWHYQCHSHFRYCANDCLCLSAGHDGRYHGDHARCHHGDGCYSLAHSRRCQLLWTSQRPLRANASDVVPVHLIHGSQRLGSPQFHRARGSKQSSDDRYRGQLLGLACCDASDDSSLTWIASHEPDGTRWRCHAGCVSGDNHCCHCCSHWSAHAGMIYHVGQNCLLGMFQSGRMLLLLESGVSS